MHLISNPHPAFRDLGPVSTLFVFFSIFVGSVPDCFCIITVRGEPRQRMRSVIVGTFFLFEHGVGAGVDFVLRSGDGGGLRERLTTAK